MQQQLPCYTQELESSCCGRSLLDHLLASLALLILVYRQPSSTNPGTQAVRSLPVDEDYQSGMQNCSRQISKLVSQQITVGCLRSLSCHNEAAVRVLIVANAGFNVIHQR